MRKGIVALFFIGTLVLTACGSSGDDSSSAETSPSTAASAAPSGAGGETATPAEDASHPRAKDVTITACAVDPVLGFPTASVSVTNHSTQQRSYQVTVAFSAGGKKVDEATASAFNVNPGAKADVTSTGTQTVKGKVTCTVAEAAPPG